MTEIRKEDDVFLERVPCIYYLLCFQKDIKDVKALIDLGNEVNAMIPAYASKLCLNVHHTDVGAQKIDSTTLNIFKMVLAKLSDRR